MKTYSVRGLKVVLDSDLATVFGVETRVLNQKVKRNFTAFENGSVFQLTKDEFQSEQFACLKSQKSRSRSQFVILNSGRGSNIKYTPFAFTKEGAQTLKTLMKSSVEIEFEEEAIEAEVLPESWNEGTVVLYQPDETLNLEVMIKDDTVWLTQDKMALLFGTQRQAITKHLKNIYDTNELPKNQTSSILEQVQKEGEKYVTRQISIYNLDAIISVGFRVNTQRGIYFRQWAIKILRDYALRRNGIEIQFNELKTRLDTHDQMLKEHQKQIDFFVKTSLPPKEQIFMQGQFFDAHREGLLKMPVKNFSHLKR